MLFLPPNPPLHMEPGGSVMIGRSLTGPLARAVNLAERLSKGQLDQEFRLGGRDELTQLGEAMASVRQSVQAAIGAHEIKLDQADAIGQVALGNYAFVDDGNYAVDRPLYCQYRRCGEYRAQ